MSAAFAPRPLSRLVALVAAALGAGTAPLAVAAAEPTVITITRGLPQSPLRVVTDPRQPRQPVPASDGADYLKTIPGFAVLRNGGVNGDPVFRGMFGSRLNLLSDGSAMMGACPSRMDAPSAYIRPESYDRLTVVKGPQTVLWGPGASAATVLFEREPARFAEPGAWGELTLLGGSHGRFDRSLDAAAGAEQGYLRLLTSRSSADDYRDGDDRRIPSRWDKWNSELLLGWTPDADTLLELAAVAGDGEARYAGRGMDGSQFKRESLSLRFERTLHDGALREVAARVYYHYADHVMDNYSLRRPSGTGMMAGPMASNVDRRTLGARLAATWRLAPGWELEAGGDGLASEHRKRLGIGIGTFDDLPWQRDAEMSQFGLFGELTRQVRTGRWIAGARLDRAAASDERPVLGSGMALRPNPLTGERREETLRAGFVRYEHDFTHATAYAGVGHSERFPDYWELYSPEQGPAGSVSAFAAIEPEQTTQLDVGIQYEHGAHSAWATAYAGVVDDFILFRYRSQGMGMTTSAADNVDARVAGAEIGAGYRVGAWSFDSSLAYAWGENRSDGRALPQMPPLEARLNLGWERGGWSANALWRLVARQGRIASGDGNVTGKDFDDSHGFGVFSLNGAWRASTAVKLSAGVDNLFDRAYSEHLNLAGNAGFGFPVAAERFNEPGRTLWARVDFSF